MAAAPKLRNLAWSAKLHASTTRPASAQQATCRHNKACERKQKRASYNVGVASGSGKALSYFGYPTMANEHAIRVQQDYYMSIKT